MKTQGKYARQRPVQGQRLGDGREVGMVRLVCLKNSGPGKNGRSQVVGDEYEPTGHGGGWILKCDERPGKEASFVSQALTKQVTDAIQL